MDICIVSWDKEAQCLYESIKDKCNVKYVVERDNELWGERKNGLCIVSFAKSYNLFSEKKITHYIIPCMRGINVKNGIYDRLVRNGIPSERILYAPLRFFKDKQLSKEEKTKLICRFEDRKEIDYLAIHIADHCNMNCAYCSVFSGLIEKMSFPDFEETKKAVKLLKSIFDQVVVFRVLGGEPTLNPHWLDICRWIRTIYPLADVEVVTNGTTILHMNEKELAKVREECIAFDITDYPILGDKIDDINDYLNKNQVVHYITQETEYFSKLYDFDSLRNPNENYDVCKMKFMCMNMRGYYLGVCHAAFGLERARTKFDGIEFSDDGRVDIRAQGLSAKKIIQILDRPHDICAYCNQDLTKWHILRAGDRENKKEWSI